MGKYNIDDINASITQKKKELEMRKQNISNLEQLPLADEAQKEALIENERQKLESIEKELLSLEDQKETISKNPEAYDIIQEYKEIENRKKELINQREIQERELESLSVERDSYRMQELSASINEISRQIDSLDRIMSELDERLEETETSYIPKEEEKVEEEPVEEKSEETRELETRIEETEIRIEELERAYLDVVDKGLDAKKEIYELAKELSDKYLKQQTRYETLISNHGEDAELIEDLTEILEKAKQRQRYYQITSDYLEKEIDNDEIKKLSGEVEEARVNVEEAVNRFEEAEVENNEEEYKDAKSNLEAAQKELENKDNELNALKESKSSELDELEREIEREKINVEQAKSSFDEAKKRGNQEEYDFAEASYTQAQARLKALEYRRNKLETKEENDLSEEKTKIKKLTPEEIMALERETLDAETEIIELEEKIKEAQKNRDYFDEKAKEYSDEIIDKTQELIDLINNSEIEDKKELNHLERETAQKKLEFAVGKKNKYQSILDELEKQRAEKQAIIDENNKIIAGQREVVNIDSIDENEITDDNPSEGDQSDDSGEDTDTAPTEENDEVDSDDSNDQPEEEPVEVGEPDVDEPSGPSEPEGDEPSGPVEPEGDEPRGPSEPEGDEPTGDEPSDDGSDDDFSLLDDDEEIYPSELQEILVKIRTNPDTDEAVGVSMRERKRVENANISLSNVWKNEIYADQTTYSVVSLAPTLVKMGILGIKKLAAKIMGTAGAKRKLEMVRENIQNLSDHEKKVLFTEYMNNNMVSEIALQPINGVIRDEAIRYIRENEIQPRVDKQGAIFTSIFEIYNIVQDHNLKIAALESGDITVDDICAELGIKKIEGLTSEKLIEQLEARKKVLVDGMDEKIKLFWKNNRKISKLYNGGGVHGIMEEERATSSKQNLDGRRGAKNRRSDEGYEESKEELRYRKALEEAIRRGDNEEAMDLFVKIEQLRLSRVEHGVGAIKLGPIPILPTFGADKGTIHYMPIAGELDYRPDPFVRNLMTTVAATVAIANSIGRIMDRIEAHHVNEHNLGVEKDIHNKADTLKGHQKQHEEMMDHQRYTDAEARRATTEYGDSTNLYGHGRYADDPTHHMGDNRAYFDAEREVENIRRQVSTGQMSSFDGFQRLTEINTIYHDKFLTILHDALPQIKKYAVDHPEYDYSGYIDSIEKMLSNPNAMEAGYQTFLEEYKIAVEMGDISVMTAPEGLFMPILGMGGAVALTGLALGKHQEGPVDQPKDLSEIVERSIENDKERKNQYVRYYEPEDEEYEEEYDDDYEEEYEEPEEEREYSNTTVKGWNAPEEEVPPLERYGTYTELERGDLDEDIIPKNGEELHEGINILDDGTMIDVYKSHPEYEMDVPEDATIKVTMKKNDDLDDMVEDEPKSISKRKGKGM